MYKRPNLGRTLRRLAEFGASDFYSGQISEDLVKDLTELGGIITREDLNNYELVMIVSFIFQNCWPS